MRKGQVVDVWRDGSGAKKRGCWCWLDTCADTRGLRMERCLNVLRICDNGGERQRRVLFSR